MIRFKLNGIGKEYSGDPNNSLLWYLREEAGVTSVKDGCSGQAACGCCTAELSGKPVLSCVTAMKRVEGGEVVTIEGLDPFVQNAFAEAFAQKGGVQCGFCTPGIVMRAAVLLKEKPNATRDEIAWSLNQHLCRCTGYKKVLDSIETAGLAIKTKIPVSVEKCSGKIGTRLPKYKIQDAVLGRRPYVADLIVPDMLHGAYKLSDHPRAKVLKIDVSEAVKMEGVERIFLAKDVPGKRVIGHISKDWPIFIAEGETTRYIGDVLAFVVAKTKDAARAAVKAVKVEYEVLKPVTDMFEALEISAPKVHENGNVLSVSKAKKGDVEAAFKDCAYIVENTFRTQFIEHAFLEPEACLAEPEKDGVKVFSQSQGVYEDRRDISRALGLPEDKVRVILVPNGGGFGGKEDVLIQGQTALAAYLLKRPVKTELTRDESIMMHPKRHALHLDYKVGATKEGKLLALRARIYGDTGAYASVGAKILERACGHATGAYFVPNVDIVSTAVYTNNIPCGAMRGFGVPQAVFAIEGCIDEICQMGGFDRWQFRWDNALIEGTSTATGQILTKGVGVRRCLEAVKDDFKKAKFAGIACGLKNTGIGNGMQDIGIAKIFVRSENQIELYHGWTEMGQGVDTIAIQTFCEETGLPPEIVSVRVDTADDAPCGMTTASRGTSLIGNSMIDACKKFNQDLKLKGLKLMAGKTYRGYWVCDWTTKPGYDTSHRDSNRPFPQERGDTHGKPICTHYSYGYAAQVVVLNDKGDVAEIIAAHDVGRIMNPMLFEGQIEGALHMGLGYAMTEELEMSGGRPKSTKLRDMGVIRAREMPKVKVIGVEVHDEFGPFGAKGVGEIGLVPTPAAVANALAAFDGIRRRSLPMRRKKAAQPQVIPLPK